MMMALIAVKGIIDLLAHWRIATIHMTREGNTVSNYNKEAQRCGKLIRTVRANEYEYVK